MDVEARIFDFTEVDGRLPSKTPPTAKASSAWKLAAPDPIDLGDNVVDRRVTHETSIFAVGKQQGPRVRMSVVGDPAITLLREPLFLPGTQGVYSESGSIKFQHRPTREGEVTSKLRIEILDSPQEMQEFRVVAAAHHAGSPTMAEQRATKRQRDDASREEIAIRPHLRHPEQPVHVHAARIHGVRSAVVHRLSKQPLIALDVPVRASGDFDSPSATLTVVRRGDGRIEYTENTGVTPGDRAHWLERKAQAYGRGADASAGARILMEAEIMNRPLSAYLVAVGNDSKENER